MMASSKIKQGSMSACGIVFLNLIFGVTKLTRARVDTVSKALALHGVDSGSCPIFNMAS